MKEKQFNKALTPEKAEEGIRLASENAKALLRDAELLLENKRFERATALAILAIEEAGKCSIIRGILLEDDANTLKKEWQNYRRRTAKNLSWILPELVAKGARKLEHMRPIFSAESDHGKILDNLKQLSFYTDASADCKWSSPNDTITGDVANTLLRIARILVNKEKTSMATKDELELWVKHMKPVWKKDMKLMKQALVDCYKEAEAKGLILEGTSKAMSEFVI